MSLLQFSKKYYGKFHLGQPFGINFRKVIEDIDRLLARSSSSFATFSYKNKKYFYFFHPYNQTMNNERIIEVPIFKSVIKDVADESVLEIGNVLSHYISHHHTVVDKYEIGDGVTNQDIVTYKSKKKFDRIISISTFEHIGFDEEKKDPKKAINAIKHVQSMLAKRGKCVISVPTRYNVDLDYYFREYAIQYPARVAFYMRTSETKWMLSSREKVLKQQYGSPYPCANGLIVAEFFAK